MKLWFRNISIWFILLSGLGFVMINHGCNPFKDDSIMTYSNFVLVNETGIDLYINNRRYHSYIGDSGIFVQNGENVLLCGDAENTSEHPFPGAVIQKIEAYVDSAGVPKLVYRQEPIINEKWVREKIDSFRSIYTLTLKEEDLVK
jgi:hypothetical protein